MKDKVEMFPSALSILDELVWFGFVCFRTVFLTLIAHDISHAFLKSLHTVSACVVNKYCSRGFLFS